MEDLRPGRKIPKFFFNDWDSEPRPCFGCKDYPDRGLTPVSYQHLAAGNVSCSIRGCQSGNSTDWHCSIGLGSWFQQICVS